MVEAVRSLDRAPEREVAREKDVRPVESHEQEPARGPQPDAGHLGQGCLDLLVGHARERLVAQASVDEPLRERAQLSRGRKEIDARLDLHGMTQTRAHRALSVFLQRAHSDGLTFVLVITGKGRAAGADPERGVLRRQVPKWLSLPEFRSLVVGFEKAHVGHGGEGALYVRIRRSKF